MTHQKKTGKPKKNTQKTNKLKKKQQKKKKNTKQQHIYTNPKCAKNGLNSKKLHVLTFTTTCPQKLF